MTEIRSGDKSLKPSSVVIDNDPQIVWHYCTNSVAFSILLPSFYVSFGIGAIFHQRRLADDCRQCAASSSLPSASVRRRSSPGIEINGLLFAFIDGDIRGIEAGSIKRYRELGFRRPGQARQGSPSPPERITEPPSGQALHFNCNTFFLGRYWHPYRAKCAPHSREQPRTPSWEDVRNTD